MNVTNPCDWIANRLDRRLPTFAVRFNDGEMVQMFRTEPEGKELGTKANQAWTSYALGDALRLMLEEFGYDDTDREALLVGCSWNTPRADKLCERFDGMVRQNGLEDLNWCHEHWPLDGIGDGSTMRLLDRLSQDDKLILVTCRELGQASRRLRCSMVLAPSADSWQGRDGVHRTAKFFANAGYTFLWCAGCGLKPTAWELFKEFPQSSHIDLGHLFNGAMGLHDYGWMARRDGWWDDYQAKFLPWFRDLVR